MSEKNLEDLNTKTIRKLTDLVGWLIEFCEHSGIRVTENPVFHALLRSTRDTFEEYVRMGRYIELGSPELQHSKDFLKVPMTHQNPF